jgi:hypothetical protein
VSDGVPTDDMFILAMVLTGREWLCADEVSVVLRRLGFTLSAQKVAGVLRRLRREDSPMILGYLTDWGGWEYSVTRCGDAQLGNRFSAIRPLLDGRLERGEREG